MPSFKSHLVSFILRHSRKKAFASPENLQRWIAYARKTEDHHPPASLHERLDITERSVDGFPVYEIAPKAGERRRILYLHGGAYVFQITSYHWGLIAEMAERLGFGITVPIYPIAPEHDFHAMFGMVGDVYRQMLDETDAEDIVFMGDSAGGNMAVVLTMMAAEEALPLPSRHVLISPGLDMSLSNPEVFEAERNDPWLGIPGGLEAIRHVQRRHRSQRLAHQPALWRPLGAAENAASDRLARPAQPRQSDLRQKGARRRRRYRGRLRGRHVPRLAADRDAGSAARQGQYRHLP